MNGFPQVFCVMSKGAAPKKIILPRGVCSVPRCIQKKLLQRPCICLRRVPIPPPPQIHTAAAVALGDTGILVTLPLLPLPAPSPHRSALASVVVLAAAPAGPASRPCTVNAVGVGGAGVGKAGSSVSYAA